MFGGSSRFNFGVRVTYIAAVFIKSVFQTSFIKAFQHVYITMERSKKII